MKILVCNRNQSIIVGQVFAKSFVQQSVRPQVFLWDDGSDSDDYDQLKEIARADGFIILPSYDIGLNGALKHSLDMIDDDWIAFCQSDVVFPQVDFMRRIESCLNNIPSSVGSIGFNVLDQGWHSPRKVAKWSRKQKFPLGILGRCNLMDDAIDEPFVGWYRGFDKPYKKPLKGLIDKYSQFPFRVEVVSWHMVVFRRAYLREIDIDTRFRLIYSMDDISYQLMLHNYDNVTIPSLTIYHCPLEKLKYAIPQSQAKETNKFFNDVNADDCWLQKWGFPWGCRPETITSSQHVQRQEFVRERYAGTPLECLSRRKIKDGPEKYYEFSA